MSAESEWETPCDATDARVDADAIPLSARAERKCAQLLDGARAVILARGFEGASVDDIAREAGMSKATMYRYYPDKLALFEAVMRHGCTRHSDAFAAMSEDERPLEDLLADLGAQHIAFALSPDAQGIFRTAIAESERFPEIGRAFYTAGIDRGRAWLAPVLAAAAKRGEIAIDDPDRAAHRFFALCKTELMFKRLFGMVDGYSEDEIAAHARDATRAFLRMCRPD